MKPEDLKYDLLLFFRDLKIENLLLDEFKDMKIIGEFLTE